MSIQSALKELCKKVTGQESTGETIEAVVRDITRNYPESTAKQAEDTKTEQE